MGHRPSYERAKLAPSAKSAQALAQLRAATDSIPNFQRHSRRCRICNHPERKAIEADFFEWKRANWIEQRYGVHGQSTIYRHARATGLDVRRQANLSRRAEEILEKVDAIETPSASLILRAVQTLASLNERGQRIKPPATHHVVSATAPPTQSGAPSVTTTARRAPRRSSMDMISGRRSSTSAPKSQESIASSLDTGHSLVLSLPAEAGEVEGSRATAVPNRQTRKKLELGATHSKQTPRVVSNRQT